MQLDCSRFPVLFSSQFIIPRTTDRLTIMFLSILRSLFAITFSLVVALALIIAIEIFSAVYHPFPPGLDPSVIEDCITHVANYPEWLLALCGVGWILTDFISAWIATRFGTARHPAHGIAIGFLLLLGAGFNMSMLPYPIWFEVGVYLGLPLATLAAVTLGRGQSSVNAVVDEGTTDS